MNVTDKLYTEWAWRTKSGVPDINNPEDKAILNNLIKELTDSDGEISKKEVIAAIQQGEFTPKQLSSILGSISGIAYKEDVISYLNTKGKAVSSITNRIYNVLVDNGDIKNYHEGITKNKLPQYNALGQEGNLNSIFSKYYSPETISFLFDIKPQVGNVATGKGEVLLSVLCSDVSGDTRAGDIDAGGKAVEVKNRGAKPYGQKAQYGTNSDKTFIDASINSTSEIVGSLENLNTRGSRPFHRLNIILNAAQEVDNTKTDQIIQGFTQALKNSYPGLDLTDFNLSKFKSGNNLDADKIEQEFGKKVIDHYRSLESFEEVLFLDDKSGNFAKVPSDRLTDLVGSKISVYQKDGLPRWSYKF